MLKHLKGQKGVTLVELILVIAVLGFVMAAALSFFLFGTRTFTLGSNQARIQQEARLATTIVAADLRTALNVRAYIDESYTQGADDYLVKRTGAGPYSLVYARPGKADLSTDPVFTSLSFNVSTENGKKFVTINAVGMEGSRQYTISSKMLLENAQTGLSDTADVIAILFEK